MFDSRIPVLSVNLPHVMTFTSAANKLAWKAKHLCCLPLVLVVELASNPANTVQTCLFVVNENIYCLFHSNFLKCHTPTRVYSSYRVSFVLSR